MKHHLAPQASTGDTSKIQHVEFRRRRGRARQPESSLSRAHAGAEDVGTVNRQLNRFTHMPQRDISADSHQVPDRSSTGVQWLTVSVSLPVEGEPALQAIQRQHVGASFRGHWKPGREPPASVPTQRLRSQRIRHRQRNHMTTLWAHDGVVSGSGRHARTRRWRSTSSSLLLGDAPTGPEFKPQATHRGVLARGKVQPSVLF
jgi:hypothetical protein